MTENKRFTSWGNRIKRNGILLNIEFKTKSDAKLCCKLLNQMDKDKQEYIDHLDEIFKWHKEHYGKSILDERLEFKSDCEKENEQLKEQLNDITLDWTQNHIEFDKDELYVKDNNTEIILKGQNLFISVFIPKIKEYFKLNYIVTGRKLEREYNTIKGEGV